MSILFQPLQSNKARALDLHGLLVGDETATYFVRVKGNGCEELGAYDGDILVVDRSRIAEAHALYVVDSDGDFSLASRAQLSSGPACRVWGAVTYVIHRT